MLPPDKGFGTSRWELFDRNISLSDRLKGRAGSLQVPYDARRSTQVFFCSAVGRN
jgi:hypothetical protein